MQLSRDCKINQLSTVTNGAANTTDITSSALDMRGFEGCLFIVAFGTITGGAVTSIKLQQSSDDAATDTYDDLLGSGQTIADSDDDKTYYIDIMQPTKRYLKLVVDRGTQNAVVSQITAIQYGAREKPNTHGTAVAGETHISPAEGTA